MILRILTSGQYELDDATVAELNDVDDKLIDAVESGDEASFTQALHLIHTTVVTKGKQLPDDYLGPSELVLPDLDATMKEVRALLDEEGLIPD